MIIQSFSFDSNSVFKEDKHGNLRVSAKVMKVGILNYQDGNGRPYTGYISKDELEKAAKTAGLKPITNKHPKELISPEDWKTHTVGTSAENFRVEERDGEQWLIGDFQIQNRNEIELIKNRKIAKQPVFESAGYLRDAIQTGSNSFDFKNIDFNHFAINVDIPRAGGASLDSIDAILIEDKKPMTAVLNKIKVGNVSLDSVTLEIDQSTHSQIVSRETILTDEIKNLESKITASKSSMDEAEGKNKVLEKKVSELEEQVKNSFSADDVKRKTVELTEVKQNALKIGIKEDFDTPEEGKKLIAEGYFGESMDSESEGTINGIYKAAIKDNSAADLNKSNQKLNDPKAGSFSKDSQDLNVAFMTPQQIHELAQRQGGK